MINIYIISNNQQMVLISVLSDALKTILNAERAGKRQVLIRPSSLNWCRREITLETSKLSMIEEEEK